MTQTYTAYITNGIGRCGTTLMFKFLSCYYKSYKFVVNIKDINNIKLNKNSVFKTHSPFPPKKINHNTKVIFMFGNIYNVACSYQKIWSVPAIKHLFLPPENLKKNYLEEDIYKFDRHFNNWLKPQLYEVMAVKYEKMYEHIKEIMDFCGLEKTDINAFPKKIERKTDWNSLSKIDKQKLINIYGHMQEYVDTLPDIQIIGKNGRSKNK